MAPKISENLPFRQAWLDHLDRLDEAERTELAEHSRLSPQDLFEEMCKLDNTDKSRSKYRRWIGKMNEYFAWLPNILSIFEPVIQSNQPAAVAVGGVKAIVMFACRSYTSFEALSLAIDRLSNCLRTLALYGENCSSEPDVYDVLVCTYKDLFSFYRKVRGLFVKGEDSSRSK